MCVAGYISIYVLKLVIHWILFLIPDARMEPFLEFCCPYLITLL